MNITSIFLSEQITATDLYQWIYETHTLYDDHKPYNFGFESINRLVNWRRNPSDLIQVADSLTLIRLVMISLVDAILTADSQTHQTSFNRNQSDLITALDSIVAQIAEATISIFLSESIVATDNLTRSLLASRVLADSLNAVDSVLKEWGVSRTALEEVFVSDSLLYQLIMVFMIYLSESLEISDSQQRVHGQNRSFSDLMTSSEGINREVSFIRTENDQIEVDDFLNYVATQIYLIYLSESIGITDSVQRSVSFTKSLVEQLNITDFLSRVSSNFIKLVDTTMVSEVATRNFLVNRALSDSQQVADSISLIIDVPMVTDNSTGPTIEAVILRPLPYTQPETMIIYSVNPDFVLSTTPTEDMIIGLKQYNSHTVYDKHIPYYSGNSNDAGPSSEYVEMIRPNLLNPI